MPGLKGSIPRGSYMLPLFLLTILFDYDRKISVAIAIVGKERSWAEKKKGRAAVCSCVFAIQTLFSNAQ
jgi:hypothetical protein